MSDIRDTGISPNHIGLVVKDIDKTAKLLSLILAPFGIGPWRFEDVISHPGELIVGEPVNLKIGYAEVEELGPVEIELLQQIEGNLYTKFLESCGEGWHHIAFNVGNIHEVISKFQQVGSKVVLDLIEVEKHHVYLEIPGGYIIELMER